MLKMFWWAFDSGFLWTAVIQARLFILCKEVQMLSNTLVQTLQVLERHGMVKIQTPGMIQVPSPDLLKGFDK